MPMMKGLKARYVSVCIYRVNNTTCFFTGGKAAGIVKGNEGITEENIEPHEEYAEISMISMEIVTAISLVSLVLYRKQKPVPVYFGVILLIFDL